MMFDRRLITSFNWFMLITALLLSLTGLLNLYSATTGFDSAISSYFKNQLTWTLIGMGMTFVIILIHYRHIASLSYFIYAGCVLLLVLVLVMGRNIAGHQSWIQLGGISLQPSEIAKIGFIIGLSRFISYDNARETLGFKEIIPSLLFFILPFLLVLKQGDLGSSLFFGLIYASLILVRGVKFKVVGVVLVGFMVLSVFAYFFFLSPYQQNRIKTFLNPEMDRKGSGYHLIQSKIAVGSGGIAGKGYLKGQTHKLKFIPERHTDFIFPVWAEEWGFMGAVFVLMLYLFFIYQGLMVASRAIDKYSFYLSVGICCLFFWHMVINLGGVLGLMPLTGVPLPFFSYGGSALLTNWIGVALLLNISMRRFLFS